MAPQKSELLRALTCGPLATFLEPWVLFSQARRQKLPTSRGTSWEQVPKASSGLVPLKSLMDILVTLKLLLRDFAMGGFIPGILAISLRTGFLLLAAGRNYC